MCGYWLSVSVFVSVLHFLPLICKVNATLHCNTCQDISNDKAKNDHAYILSSFKPHQNEGPPLHVHAWHIAYRFPIHSFWIQFTTPTVFENYRKKSHSTLRAKRASFAFWEDEAYSQTVLLDRSKFGGKCQNSNATFWVIFKYVAERDSFVRWFSSSFRKHSHHPQNAVARTWCHSWLLLAFATQKCIYFVFFDI